MGCELLPGGEKGKDTTPPTNVRVTGGVSAGESVSGQRTLQATAEDDSGKVAKVAFYVSNVLACTDAEPRDSGATFSCVWDASTHSPGSAQLIAKAHDAAGNTTSSEALSFTVAPPNHAPTLSKVSATPTAVDEGTTTTLSVTASDVDGDTLTYSWTQTPTTPAGSFSGETGATRTWLAPGLASNMTYTLEVTVSDGKGGTASATVDVAVANVPTVNRAPVVDESIIGAAPAIAGDTLNLSIGATDPDGDTLTYSWTTEPAGAGTFTNASASAAQWRSSDISAATSYTLKVTVSDGADSVTRSVVVDVSVPTYAAHIQPIWTATCVSCHNSSTGTRGGLNLDVDKSHASLINVNAAGSPCGTSFKRVVPNQPDSSLLVLKLGPTPPCGARMPTTDTTYFDRNPGLVTRIRSWILAGAPNN
jgi:hypothetical protein